MDNEDMEAEFFSGFLSYISEENCLTEYYSTFKMFISRTKAGSIPLPVSQYLTPLYEYFGKFYSEEPSLPVRSREGIQHYYKSVGLIHLVLIEKFPCRNAKRYVLLAIYGIIDIWLLRRTGEYGKIPLLQSALQDLSAKSGFGLGLTHLYCQLSKSLCTIGVNDDC